LPPFKVNYVTSSEYKVEENRIFQQKGRLSDGTKVGDVAQFEFRSLRMKETLEIDIRVMVEAEVTKAYSQIKVPCIVEHAGLIFDDHRDELYPGGLTKPMWDALKDRFIEETHSADHRAIARAVVAYCDGMQVHTFVGETAGMMASAPRGSRTFYWDSVFIPDDPTGRAAGRTYAEIVDDPSLGLEYKVLNLSQSTRAMQAFVEHLRTVGQPKLWS
jgi:inosine/xanthosine triphosphate pyrophosphatase family protein